MEEITMKNVFLDYLSSDEDAPELWELREGQHLVKLRALAQEDNFEEMLGVVEAVMSGWYACLVLLMEEGPSANSFVLDKFQQALAAKNAIKHGMEGNDD